MAQKGKEPARPEVGPPRGLLSDEAYGYLATGPAATGPAATGPAAAAPRDVLRRRYSELAARAGVDLSGTPYGAATLEPLLRHGMPPYSEAAYPGLKALFDLGNKRPPGYSSNVEIDGRPEGWSCTAKDGMVSCSVPGFGTFPSFPRPEGWPDTISSESPNAHFYDEQVVAPPLGGLLQAIIDHPTPGTSRAATPEGSYNDATPGRQGNDPRIAASPVDSYVLPMPDTGRRVVMNVTRDGHVLWPGIVFRIVEKKPDGRVVVHNVGIGAGALQKPDTYTAAELKSIWPQQTRGLFEMLDRRTPTGEVE